MSILQDLLNLLFGLGNMSDQTEDFTLVLDPVVFINEQVGFMLALDCNSCSFQMKKL